MQNYIRYHQFVNFPYLNKAQVNIDPYRIAICDHFQINYGMARKCSLNKIVAEICNIFGVSSYLIIIETIDSDDSS
jgi:hypothetical protein